MHKYILIFLLVGLAGCATKVANHGFVDHDKVAKIQKGKDSKDAVFYILGSPSSSSSLEKDSWYYISGKQEGVAFFKPELKNQEVTVITFDENEIVVDIQKYNMDDRKEIKIAEDKTETVTKDMSILQQLMGNLGRFNSGGHDVMSGTPN